MMSAWYGCSRTKCSISDERIRLCAAYLRAADGNRMVIKLRPTVDEYYLRIAHVVGTRSTCARRAVGCVIVDDRGYILSTGYNGVPSGFPHCIEHPCSAAMAASGTDLDRCNALHAEQNAIARLREPFEATTLYCTVSPCVSCTKLALATGIQRIVSTEQYASHGRALWEAAGRRWHIASGEI